ncbi:solute carrier family 35 member F6-like [Glandiceps talaboti]
MAWTKYQIFLAVLMVITGSINTLSAKWADELKAVGDPKYTDSQKPRSFNHPFFQAVGMFIGEMSCLLAFKILVCYKNYKQQPIDIGPQKFSPFVMMPASLCDMTGTSLMYLGLTMTTASSFQMLRGAVIIFTGLLSVGFLNRKLYCFNWTGIITVVAGLVVVGAADILFGESEHADINGIIAGNLLIIMAQIIVAIQMVYEERFLTKYNVPPLQAVGWEGFFGFMFLSLLLIPFYYINAGDLRLDSPGHRLEDAIDAFYQMANNHLLILAFLGNMVSIAFFNFAGISVTKEISATTRMVLDSVRTVVIWGISCLLRWENFLALEVLGFVLLICGQCIYNDIIFTPFLRKRGVCLQCLQTGEEGDESEHDPLINGIKENSLPHSKDAINA